MNRREFLQASGAAAVALGVSGCASPEISAGGRVGHPNIILCMTDDQGWGDVSYNGLKHVETPNLDAMSKAGVRFDRFYAAHPSCSPTRASVLTGRHPYRAGVYWPGMQLRKQEVTIADAVKRAGYATGHFGKWHLSGGKPGPGRALPVADPFHPGHFGFDYWFSVSNWFDTDWTFSRMGEEVTVPGDGSDAIVAEALAFIERQSKTDTPFLAVIWFGSPHVPLKPTAEDQAAAGGSAYYGEILGIDRSMGTLREGLRELGIAENTMLWFNSDNGAWEEDNQTEPDKYGSNGPLRGRKGQLWEAGIRVPGLLEWPAGIKKPFTTNVPVVTSDMYPTVLDVLDIARPHPDRPIDGISLLPLFDGKMNRRPNPIGFWHPAGADVLNEKNVAFIDNRYKLHKHGANRYALYDIEADMAETTDIADQYPDVVSKLKTAMSQWRESVRRSERGEDYTK